MSRLSVLVVEDEFLVSLCLEDFLSAEGHDVVDVVMSLSGAFDALNRYQFDIAILDIDLGKELVWPFAKKLEELGKRYVFLSANINRSDFPDECIDAPRISKPFRDDDMRRVIDARRAA